MPIPTANVLRNTLSPISPRTDLQRTRFGRALNLDRIEGALRSADHGSMQLLTDLSRETIDTDPHLAAVLNKRFGAVSALPWDIVPASGHGIDKERARFYAEVVRDQLKQLPNFKQKINQLAWGLFDGRAALENEWLLVGNVPGITPPASSFGTVRWMIRDLEWVHPRRLQFGPTRELRISDRNFGNFSETGIGLNELPLKFVQFMPQLFGDYQEREGLARRCLYWSFFKRSGARERLILMELFGKPWRWLEVAEDSSADADDLSSADEQLQQLGGLASFRFPRGTELKVQQPIKGAGEVHKDVIEESDKQLSKLVLGQTGTTDANPAGLNNAQANVMQDEQFMILTGDASLVSESVETGLTDAIIELNFGHDALPHAPHFVLRADVPLDRTKEIGRVRAAVEAGLEVPLAEAYEVSGFRVPREDEPVIKLDTPPAHPLAVQPPVERPVIAFPEAAKLPPRKLQPIAPSDEGVLPNPTGGQGGMRQDTSSPDPLDEGEAAAGDTPADELISMSNKRKKYKADSSDEDVTTLPFAGFEDFDECVNEMKADGHDDESAARICGALQQQVEGETGQETGHIDVTRGIGPIVGKALAKADPRDAAVMLHAYHKDGLTKGCDCCLPVHLQNGEGEEEELDELSPQPVDREEVGTVETVITRGKRAGARASTTMAEAYVNAVQGLEEAREINAALERAAEDQDVSQFARVTERNIMIGALSGALASHFEITAEEDTPELVLERMRVNLERSFTERPFTEAIRWFQRLNVVTRATFNQLDAAAKRRAFTVANIHNQRQLEIAKAELTRQMQTGASLAGFSEALSERFTSAGMTVLNPSHVETVYRTNVVNAYNSGRHTHMTQPSVLRTHGFWQIRTVNDGPPRQRNTHRAVHGWVLSASDSVWQRVFPPFGFNCRCRVVSLSNLDVERKGLRVRTGGEIRNLPDRGFTSGTPTLLT